MKRLVLLAVAALLVGSGLLAIVILAIGRFGEVEGRILGTTMLLAGYGVVSLPGVVLLDQGRRRRLALATCTLAALAAALALASIWSEAGDTLGRTVGTVTILAVAAAQVSALSARRAEHDPLAVTRLFAASCVTAAVLVAAGTTLLWTNPHDSLYPRLFGALVVLDLVLVALQPVLARARPQEEIHRFAITLASGETVRVEIAGGDVASAAAKAIRRTERDGGVVRLEVVPAGLDSWTQPPAETVSRAPASTS